VLVPERNECLLSSCGSIQRAARLIFRENQEMGHEVGRKPARKLAGEENGSQDVRKVPRRQHPLTGTRRAPPYWKVPRGARIDGVEKRRPCSGEETCQYAVLSM